MRSAEVLHVRCAHRNIRCDAAPLLSRDGRCCIQKKLSSAGNRRAVPRAETHDKRNAWCRTKREPSPAVSCNDSYLLVACFLQVLVVHAPRRENQHAAISSTNNMSASDWATGERTRNRHAEHTMPIVSLCQRLFAAAGVLASLAQRQVLKYSWGWCPEEAQPGLGAGCAEGACSARQCSDSCKAWHAPADRAILWTYIRRLLVSGQHQQPHIDVLVAVVAFESPGHARIDSASPSRTSPAALVSSRARSRTSSSPRPLAEDSDIKLLATRHDLSDEWG